MYVFFHRVLLHKAKLTIIVLVGFVLIRILQLQVYDPVTDETNAAMLFEDETITVSRDFCFRNIKDTESLFHNSRTFRELQQGTAECQQVRRPSINISIEKYWHTLETSEQFLAVYSAYFDDRPTLGVTSWIRILGITNNTNGTFYCHVWYNDCQSPYVVQASLNGLGRPTGYFINNMSYVQYMFSCRLPGHEPVPSHVSVVFNNRCSVSSFYLAVQKPVRSEPEHEFGVCVAIAFGNVPLAEFVEWMEILKIFGVTEFNVYDAGMVNMSDVFAYYVKRGLLKVHPMPPPVTDLTSLNTGSLEVYLTLLK